MIKFVFVASHFAIGNAVRQRYAASIAARDDTSTEDQDAKNKLIENVKSGAEEMCPCANATAFVDFYADQQFLAIEQCISLYYTSKSNVSVVKSIDADGVAEVETSQIQNASSNCSKKLKFQYLLFYSGDGCSSHFQPFGTG